MFLPGSFAGGSEITIKIVEKHMAASKTISSGRKDFSILKPPIEVDLDSLVSCRLYEDTRPHCLEITPLQKGLVLIFKGEELIEEGAGFGVPVAIYEDEPYFSSTAKCSVLDEGKRRVLVKSFVMDTVSRKRIWKADYMNGGNYRFFHRVFHEVYARNSLITPFFSKLIELTKLFGVNTEFVKVPPRGIVEVRYTCSPSSIEIEASFDHVEKRGCRELVLLNEQGASFFRKYADSNGLTLWDGNVGAWMPVNANEAFLSNVEGTLAFSLRKKHESTLFRGREKIRNRYSWVGLGYRVHPETSTLSYNITLVTKGQRITRH